MGTYYKDSFGNLYEELPSNVGDLTCVNARESIRLNVATNNSESFAKFCLGSKAVNYKKLFTMGKTSYTQLKSITVLQGVGVSSGQTYKASSLAVIVTSTDTSASANYLQIQVTSSFNTGDVTTDYFGDSSLSSVLIARCGLIQKANGQFKASGFVWVYEKTYKDGTKTYGIFGNPCDVGMGKYWNGDYLQLNGESIRPNFDDVNEVKEDSSEDNGEDGGYGSNDNPRNTIKIPTIPSINLNKSGSSLYALTEHEMYQFTKYLWTSDWTVNIKKLRNEPMENIINIGLIDVNVGGFSTSIILGNLDTQCMGALIPRFVEVDCGSITLNEYYGTFADYEPYTKISLYLPKIGVISLPCDLIMNNTLSVKYHIELSSGEGICYLYIYNNREDFGYIYNTYSCSCVASVPLSSSSHSALIQSQVSAVASLGGSIASGSPLSITSSALSGAWNVASTKVPTETRGSMGNMSSLMCHKKPYLMINATYLCKPTDFKINNGHNSYITASIGTLSGFCKTKSYHADFEAPMECLVEIENILNSGFYI